MIYTPLHIRQIPPSPQVQNMFEESQRTQDREIIQEREALFNQPSTVSQPQHSGIFDIMLFYITNYEKFHFKKLNFSENFFYCS